MPEIIAEAGVNHNGDPGLALKLVDAAADAGADCVKFQTFSASGLVTRAAEKAAYQRETGAAGENQLDLLKRLELGEKALVEIMRRCRERGIKFLSTPFDLQSVDLLHGLGMSVWKIPSGEITNVPLLRRIGSFGNPVILSSGMAVLGEIENALMILEEAGTKRADITVLHCTTEYPAPIDEVNLNAMATIRKAFGVQVGYSDHTAGIEVAIAAAALGARIIEKHLTLDRTLPGPDHAASLEPPELASMVKAVRNVTRALGNGMKTPSPSERANIPITRKSIVAAVPILRGERFTESNVTTKRPGTGLSPLLWDLVIGARAQRDFQPDDPITLK